MWYPGKDASFQLSGLIFLRGLGFVYCAAFLCLYNDLLGLLGSNGLLPAHLYIEQLQEHYGDRMTTFWELPSLFHMGISDAIMQYAALTGILLSISLMLGYANVPILFGLWAALAAFGLPLAVFRPLLAFPWPPFGVPCFHLALLR